MPNKAPRRTIQLWSNAGRAGNDQLTRGVHVTRVVHMLLRQSLLVAIKNHLLLPVLPLLPLRILYYDAAMDNSVSHLRKELRIADMAFESLSSATGGTESIKAAGVVFPRGRLHCKKLAQVTTHNCTTGLPSNEIAASASVAATRAQTHCGSTQIS